MAPHAQLPPGFESLERFVDHWALPKENARMARRWASPMLQISEFYDAMVARVDEALDHLGTFDLTNLPNPEERLFHLTLALVEVGNAVELYKQPTSPYSISPERYVRTE